MKRIHRGLQKPRDFIVGVVIEMNICRVIKLGFNQNCGQYLHRRRPPDLRLAVYAPRSRIKKKDTRRGKPKFLLIVRCQPYWMTENHSEAPHESSFIVPQSEHVHH